MLADNDIHEDYVDRPKNSGDFVEDQTLYLVFQDGLRFGGKTPVVPISF